MSHGVVSLLDLYLERTTGRSSVWRTVMNDPLVFNAEMDTRSLSSIVTDSAAASSSWGAGQHVWNGQINEYPDGTKLTPIFELLGSQNVRRGLISTATITHATPAGFAVAIDQRDKEAEIARLYLNTGIDLFLGGGDNFFNPEYRSDKADVAGEFRAKGYEVVRDKASLMASKGSKVLGLWSRGHVPYYVDRLNQPTLAGVPSLAEQTRFALDRLGKDRNGFFLQIEAARVDHAAHENDTAGLVFDQMEFDEAVKVAMEFAIKDKETLIIITSDHGNSNPGINGSGPEYGESTAGLLTLRNMKGSYEFLLRTSQSGIAAYDALRAEGRIRPNADSVKSRVKEVLGLELTPDEVALIMQGLSLNSPLKAVEQYAPASSLMSLVLSNHTHVGWCGRQHTNDFTMLSAFGPGAEKFHGVVPNVKVFDILTEFRGIKHKNPTMSYEDAKRAMAKKTERAEISSPHWI